MASEFKLPTLGENVSSGTVGKLLVAKGDQVSENQPVVEIETDKAVAEIPSSVNGTVLEIKVKEGQSVKVGQVIFTYKEGAGKSDAPAPAKEAPAAPPAEAPRPQAPPANVHAFNRPAAPAPAAKSAHAPAPPRPAARRSGPVVAAPSVRRLARELGVDINEVPTSDPAGRVTIEDIQSFAYGKRSSSGEAATPVRTEAAESADTPYQETRPDNWGPVAVEPMNNIRKKTVEYMTQCWTTIPHVTHFEKADITELEALRKRYGKKVEAGGGKLTVTSFILKVAAEALKRFPKFNSSIDLENEQILLKQYYNIGVAAETEHGLLVPVIRDVDKKSVLELSAELPALAEKARNRKLTLDEMQGGTFTISNLGGLGGTGFTPIISAPQVAILGVSRSQLEPVFVNGQFAPRLMLPLSLSYDHRVIDGADAARFLRWFCEALEQPWILFLEQ